MPIAVCRRCSNAQAFLLDLWRCAGAFFEPLCWLLVSRGDFAHLLPDVCVAEGLGSGPDFLGARTQVPSLQ
jgi:hypothetical protein